MRAKPVRLIYGEGYVECSIEEATHVTINIPGPTGKLTLPVILRGSRDEKKAWTWNGSVDEPTLRPSVLTESYNFRCHSWISDGEAVFLEDCSHEQANLTVPLFDVNDRDVCGVCRKRDLHDEGVECPELAPLLARIPNR